MYGERESIDNIDCQIESLSIADNIPIKELVLEDVDEVCSVMSNKVEFILKQSDCFNYAYQQIKLPLESTSVTTRGSQLGLNNLSVRSIKSHPYLVTSVSFCSFVTSDVKLMSFSGCKYQTNPVTYVPISRDEERRVDTRLPR